MEKVYLSKWRLITSIFLWLVAIHSFIVGLCLILLPQELIKLFGFNNCPDNFFQAQGGIFHIALCYAYVGSALNPTKQFSLIKLAIFAKLVATLFLLSYYVFFNQILTILFSGIGDFLMGLVMFFLLKKLKSFKPEL